MQKKLAIVIPCHNEAVTIARVVSDFKSQFPDAQIVVANNASTDETAQIAAEAGARVIDEIRQGKGFAVTRLFSDIEADCYVLVDGDATYFAEDSVRAVNEVLENGIDHVFISRTNGSSQVESHRLGHDFGNRVLTSVFNKLFGLNLADTLTGYRVMSRRFVKSFAAIPQGFEIETELNVHTQIVSASVMQLPGKYVERPIGSNSKLNTYTDGWRILRKVFKLFRDTKPVLAFSMLALPWLVLGSLLSYRALIPFLSTGVVEHFPSLIAGVGAILFATLLFIAGLILSRTANVRQEMRRLAFLNN